MVISWMSQNLGQHTVCQQGMLKFARRGLQLKSELLEPPHTELSRAWITAGVNVRIVLIKVRIKATGLSDSNFSCQK